MRRRVLVAITARPSYSRIKSALEAIRSHPDLELQIVVMASALLDRYGNVAEVIERDGFEIHDRLYTVLEGDQPLTMVKTTGLGMVDLANVFARLKPDVVVTIADRYETLATATAAAYMNIPLVHIQGGEVTGSIDDKVRNAVTQLADVHCVATRRAGARVASARGDVRLRRLGEDARTFLNEPGTIIQGTRHAGGTVYVTGCPSIDLAAKPYNLNDPIIRGGVGPDIDTREPFIIVMQHPVTDEWEDAYDQAINTALCVGWAGIPAVWLWPNVDAGSDGTSKALRCYREEHHPQLPIHFTRNLPPEQFLALAQRAACIVGNSSFGIREASYLGLPAIDLGTRQAGRERGPNVVSVPNHGPLPDREQLMRTIKSQAGKRYERSTLYGDGHAGERIAEVIAKMDISKRRAA